MSGVFRTGPYVRPITSKQTNKEVLILRRRTQKSIDDKSFTTAPYYHTNIAIAAQSEVIHKIIAQTFKSKLDMKSI